MHSIRTIPTDKIGDQEFLKSFLQKHPLAIHSLPDGDFDKEAFILENFDAPDSHGFFPEFFASPKFMLKFISTYPNVKFWQMFVDPDLWKNKPFVLDVRQFYLEKNETDFHSKQKAPIYKCLDPQLQNDPEIQELFRIL